MGFDLRALFAYAADQTFANAEVLKTKAKGLWDGSLTVVDTSTGTVKVVSNELEIVGSGVESETGILSDGLTKALGKGFLFRHTAATAINSTYSGLRPAQSLSTTILGYRWVMTDLWVTAGAGAAPTVSIASVVNSTDYDILILSGGYDASAVPYKSGDTVGDFRRGIHYFIKGGTFTSWTRVWLSNNDNTGTLYGMLAVTQAGTAQLFDNLYIPTLPLNPATMYQPVMLDTFTGTNGESLVTTHLPDVVASVSSPGVTAWESGADTWDIQSNKARNSPGLDADIAPDNTCTTDVARTEADATTGWTNSGMATFASVVEGTEPNGTWSLHLVANSAGDYAVASVTTVVGRSYLLTYIYKKNAATDSSVLRLGTSADDSSLGTRGLSSTTWSTKTLFFVATSTTSYITIREDGASDDAEIWVDVLKVEPITLNEMLASDDMSIVEGLFDIDGTIAATTDGQVGIVSHLDDKTAPANCVLAYYNRLIGKAQLFKLVAGVGTSLINTTATYAAGGKLRVIAYLSGSDLKARLYYNGALIGTEQTISNAGIVSNTRHGMISVDSSNTVDNFVAQPRTDPAWDLEIEDALQQKKRPWYKRLTSPLIRRRRRRGR